MHAGIMPPMSRSYEADEHVFQKLRAAGKSSWDEQADPERSFDNFIMRPFLQETLAAIAGPLDGLAALEIGCGSGPIACFLAGRGLTVRGIDVSPTALEMARRHADQRGLSVRFDAADICRMPAESERYDLVIDGHCLHYLVLDEHRRDALSAIHRLLKPTGLLLIETMISHPGLLVGANYRFDAQCVLSIKVADPAGREDAFASGSAWFAPYRRLLTSDQVVTELEQAGFEIQFRRAVAQADGRKPKLMQVRAGLRCGCTA
jgi:2-polyprenyl-3-methyl-5-hydroxy-6-metoxy-1,4-benzoquinol methylase